MMEEVGGSANGNAKLLSEYVGTCIFKREVKETDIHELMSRKYTHNDIAKEQKTKGQATIHLSPHKKTELK